MKKVLDFWKTVLIFVMYLKHKDMKNTVIAPAPFTAAEMNEYAYAAPVVAEAPAAQPSTLTEIEIHLISELTAMGCKFIKRNPSKKEGVTVLSFGIVNQHVRWSYGTEIKKAHLVASVTGYEFHQESTYEKAGWVEGERGSLQITEEMTAAQKSRFIEWVLEQGRNGSLVFGK